MNVEDRFEILDLISNYSYAFDEIDIEKFLSLFIDEQYLGDRTTDKEGMRQLVKSLHKNNIEFGSQCRHLQTNIVLEELSDGLVSGKTMYTVLLQYRGDPNPRLVSCGIYEDEFVKTPDGWKFRSRKIIPDHD
jgi:hypothetical protein